ncbi:hypothetical protein H072_4667 [Dactylellina haptotyla CBS 200.50]|uniref:F-box domain-containing protein n=1 Tax=Dactylellina haptotyla (strain CBS 200.50) TaxID=1284197 RepID=S8AEI4_DACHA|nr:hypothetical protein H072_4667 [Dactylellina haptotyla CBS 200.50]
MSRFGTNQIQLSRVCQLLWLQLKLRCASEFHTLGIPAIDASLKGSRIYLESSKYHSKMYQYSGYPRVNVAPSRIYSLPKEIWDEIILHLDYSFLEIQTIIRPVSYYFYSLYSNSFCKLPPYLWERVFANLPFTDLVTTISLTCNTFRRIITNPTSPTLQSILLRESFGKGTARIYARRIAAGDVHVHPALSLSRETNNVRWTGTGEDHRIVDTLALTCLGADGFRKYSKANATSPPVECLQVRIPGVGRSVTVSKKKIIAEQERRIKKLRRDWGGLGHRLSGSNLRWNRQFQ